MPSIGPSSDGGTSEPRDEDGSAGASFSVPSREPPDDDAADLRAARRERRAALRALRRADPQDWRNHP